jgi:hypothetical protein
MKTLSELGRINTNLEMQKGADEFGRLVHHILRHRGKFAAARIAAREGNPNDVRGLTTRLVDVLKASPAEPAISRQAIQKAAQSAGVLAGSTFADAAVITQGWLNSLASYGVFDRLLADGAMKVIPLQPGTVGAANVAAVAYSIAEGSMKPISRISLTGAATSLSKAHCAVVITQELARSVLLSTTNFINTELSRSLATQVDVQFINNMIVDITPAASAGTSPISVRSDIEWLTRQVRLDSNSRPYIVTTPQICETWSMMSTTTGAPAFPDLGPLGGFVAPGLPVLTSDITAGLVVLINASAIAAASGEVILREFEEAMVQMDDAPTSPPTASTPFVSMWQNNWTGIRAERFFIGQKLRTDATAAILNANSYSSSGSP